MTMMQKIQAKKSKKGFTLVELVIVIAILAILAAIAIPVITTTINASKLSTMESDLTTVDMLVKEAVNTSKASITSTTYNGNTAATATVDDVLTENGLVAADILAVRTIGGQSYQIGWDTATETTVISSTDTVAYPAPGGWLDMNGAPINTLAVM